MMQTASSSQLQATLQASTSQLIETAQLVKQQAEEKDAALDQAEKKNRDLNSLLAQQDATIKLLSKEKQEALEDAEAEKNRNEDMRRSAENRYLETISSKERQIKQLSDEKQQAQTQAEADKKRLEEKREYAENLLNKERDEHNKLSEGKKKVEEDLEKLDEEKKKVEEDLKALQDKCASQHGRKRRRRRRTRRSRSRSRRRARGSKAKKSDYSSDDHADDFSDTSSEPSSEPQLHPYSKKKLRDLIHKSLQKSPGERESLSVLTQRVKERFNEDGRVPPDDKALLNMKGFSIKSWVKKNCSQFGTCPDRDDGRNDTIIFIKSGHHGGS